MSSIDHQNKSSSSPSISTIKVPIDDNNQKSKTISVIDHQKRKSNNTVRILMNATMQFLSSPPTSPVSSNFCSSPSSITSNESSSSYFSFPEFEIYDEIKREVDNMIVQMERFDEMYVNGVRIPVRQV